MRADLTFLKFSEINRQRSESPEGFNSKLENWSLSDWMTATLGELGEAANVVKKLNRIRDNIPGNKEEHAELLAQLADELGDTFIYLDLMAQAIGHDIGYLACAKFDKTSERIGYPIRLSGIISSGNSKNEESP